MFIWDDDKPVPYIDTIRPWPHQAAGLDAVITELVNRTRRILATSPTGGGKTWWMVKVALAALSEEWGVTLFANRKLLIEQMQRALVEYGVGHGVRAAGHARTMGELFQIASLQTEYSRVVKRKVWGRHNSGLVLLDEAHVNNPKTNRTVRKVLEEYLDAGAQLVGFTATPLGLDGCYDVLIQAGTNSELRACGALVPATHYGCTEPDLTNIRRYKVGEDLSDPDNVKAIMVPGIHGRVIEHFRRLNPHGLPTIGFAPGVPESVGFAEAFEDAGIPAGHIDGERVWIRGQEYPSTEDTRNELLRMSKSGELRVVWNRFVLREAIDMPWLRHGIFAAVFGSLQSYLQSGGRLLRAYPLGGKTGVTVQDHGGNWHRHGSLNADRNWRLTDTNSALANARAAELGGDTETPPTEPEPFLCPRCGAVVVLPRVIVGSRCRCHNCGNEFDFRRRSRPVLQSNGELVEHTGNIFRPKRVERRNDTFEKWKQMYWRARNSKTMTFNQAVGKFFVDNGYFPPKSLPLMPRLLTDWYLPVSRVDFKDLRSEAEYEH